MSLTKYNKENLQAMRALIESMSNDQFKKPLDILTGASIGAHARHILEFYICLLRDRNSNTICYDNRERNQRIENDRSFALAAIDNIILELENIKSDCKMRLKADFSISGEDPMVLDTSIFRELAYCLEHSTHHEALIKVGVNFLAADSRMANNFGVASSTIRYLNN